jgi:alkylhydroperoxidase/carboxymuconolactone decarboxylase family protein YurZ
VHTVRPDSRDSRSISVAEVAAEVAALLDGVPEGTELDPRTAALVELAVVAAPTTLHLAKTSAALRRALDVGVTAEQLQETLVLVSGVGMHTLIGTASILADELRVGGDLALDLPLEGEAAEFARYLLDPGGREARVAQVSPDFWPNMLRLSPLSAVRAVAEYRAVPWASTTLTALQRELVGIAVDAMPSHRFLPTLLMHVRQATAQGAGRRAVRQVLDIAAAAPDHPGVR